MARSQARRDTGFVLSRRGRRVPRAAAHETRRASCPLPAGAPRLIPRRCRLPRALACMMESRGVQAGQQLCCLPAAFTPSDGSMHLVFLFLNIHAAAYIYMHADEDPDSVGTGIILRIPTQVL